MRRRMSGGNSGYLSGSRGDDHSTERGVGARQAWLRCLAHADPQILQAAWDRLAFVPDYEMIRSPETGLAMVRGQTGSGGQPFNLGEMTVTRCAVRMAGGQIGIGYVAGRSKRHATLIALFDGMLQDGQVSAQIHDTVIVPLAQAQERRRAEEAARAAGTKVEFFTMSRGD